MLVLMLPRISSRVSGFPVASPCLWGKLQNLSLSKVSKQVVMSLCVAGAALQTSLAKCHACHGICTLSPLDAALPMRFAKIRGTTHLKCCACHAKWRWTGPKWRPCHENCNASFENVAKVLRLPHKTTFDTLQNTSECHEVSRLPCETKQRHMKPPKVTPFAEHLIYRHGHKALTRTVADGCGRLRTVADGCGRLGNVERTHPQPPEPQSDTGTLAMHSGKHILRTDPNCTPKYSPVFYSDVSPPSSRFLRSRLRVLRFRWQSPEVFSFRGRRGGGSISKLGSGDLVLIFVRLCTGW